MTSSRSAAISNRIADTHFTFAEREGRRKASRGPSSGAIEPFLHDVRYQPRTDEALAAELEREAAERHTALSGLLRRIRERVGCDGYDCASAHHGTHLRRMSADPLLQMVYALGLRPDPLSKRRREPGGTEKKKAKEQQ